MVALAAVKEKAHQTTICRSVKKTPRNVGCHLYKVRANYELARRHVAKRNNRRTQKIIRYTTSDQLRPLCRIGGRTNRATHS